MQPGECIFKRGTKNNAKHGYSEASSSPLVGTCSQVNIKCLNPAHPGRQAQSFFCNLKTVILHMRMLNPAFTWCFVTAISVAPISYACCRPFIALVLDFKNPFTCDVCDCDSPYSLYFYSESPPAYSGDRQQMFAELISETSHHPIAFASC